MLMLLLVGNPAAHLSCQNTHGYIHTHKTSTVPCTLRVNNVAKKTSSIKDIMYHNGAAVLKYMPLFTSKRGIFKYYKGCLKVLPTTYDGANTI